MGRRILNRKDLRADFDAAERRKDEVDEKGEDEEEKDEDEEEGEEKEADAEEEEDGEAAEAEGEGEDDEEEAPKKKKAPPKPKVKAKAKPRSRAAKITRMRVVWGVFSNSNQCVATYEYPKKQEAVDHATRLTADKRNTHFVQPIKEPIEEKKEKEK
jgi:cobalamin biosynthesis protein CobT